jgi:hypothetical protein
MKATYNFKTIILAGMTVISTLAFGQNKESKVWMTFENTNAIPSLNTKGNLISTDSEMNALIVKHNITSVEKPLSNSKNAELNQVIELTCTCNQDALISDLKSKSRLVRKVEMGPNYETLETPNDYTLSFEKDYALNLINAQAAWDITTGSSSVIIGISDQNFYANHEELIGKVTNYDNTNTATKTHGTAVAITAAGKTNNGAGKSSIGYNSSVGLYKMTFNEVLAASYAGCRVVNLSWTSGCTYNSFAQAAINEVFNNGTFIVASAGNGNSTCSSASNLVYPASYAHVFSVSSVGPENKHQKIAGDMNSTHQHNDSVDLCAPGYDVALSIAPGTYLKSSGTSFAAPYVSGTVALMLSVNPCLTNVEIEYILKQTAMNLNQLNPDYAGKLGSGRLDALAAVLLAKSLTKLQLNATVHFGCTENSGSIDLQILNGTAPYNVTWSNGSNTLNLDNLRNGTYSVSVVDATGCKTGSQEVEINAVTTTLEAIAKGPKYEDLNNGSINLIVTGDEILSYTWSNGSSAQNIKNLSIGLYSVTIETVNGCIINETFELTALIVNQDTSNNDNNDNAYDRGNSRLMNQVNNFEMSVYPNPTSSNATIAWTGTATSINVLNFNGQSIMNQEVNQINSVELNSLASGVYYIKLADTNNEIHTEKLVVQ